MTTSTPNDPAICKHCNRAHGGGWNPRHMFEPMTAAPSPFITDPTDLRCRQIASHTRAKAGSHGRAVEALRNADMGIHAAAVQENMPGALDNARRFLTRTLRDNADRSVKTIASLRTALGAVGEAWAWELTDTEG